MKNCIDVEKFFEKIEGRKATIKGWNGYSLLITETQLLRIDCGEIKWMGGELFIKDWSGTEIVETGPSSYVILMPDKNVYTIDLM